MKKILFLFLLLSASVLSVSASTLNNASLSSKLPPTFLNPDEPAVLIDVQVVDGAIRFRFDRPVYVYDAVVMYTESYNVTGVYNYYRSVRVVEVPTPTQQGLFEISVNTKNGKKYSVRGFLNRYGEVVLDWAYSIGK